MDLAGSERANRTGNVGARLKYAPSHSLLSFSISAAMPLIWPNLLSQGSRLPGLHADQALQMCVLPRSVMMRDNEQVRFGIKARFCRESVAINASLMTLGRCLEALRWNQQHRAAEPKLVPYRESKASPFTLQMHACWSQKQAS